MRLRLFVLMSLLAVVSPAVAEEPSREFLAGLRERRFFDEALEYLERAANNRRTPVDFQAVIPLERALLLRDQARASKDKRQALKMLADATESTRSFLVKQPAHERVLSAREVFALTLIERAQMSWAVFDEEVRAPDSFVEEARDLYDRSERALTIWERETRKALTEFPKFVPRSDVKTTQRRNELRTALLQAGLMRGTVAEEAAGTWPDSSKTHTVKLETAVQRYESIYRKYRTRVAGLYARFYQARCLDKLKRRKEATAIFDELLQQPQTPAVFLTFRSRVLLVAIPSLAHPSIGRGGEAVKLGDAWVKKLRSVNDRSGDIEKLQAALNEVKGTLRN
ncbi:MAG: hypothetical protein QGG36_18900 [Pirellulaceae bacterium]|nr:hypothetical protein [Pirellulaceae bacterium]